MPGASHQSTSNSTGRRRPGAHMEGLVVGNETIEFQLLNKLGSGGYGTVYRARCLDLQDKLFAIKVVELGVPGTQNYKVRRRELDYHFLLQSHPNIVGFHGHISDDDHTYMIMDYCPGGNLRHAITKKRIFARNDALVKSIFLQLIDAIQACHDAGIYHRDLKPENILINPQMTEVYVTDFGLSTKKLISTAFGAGTTHYMSPDCLNSNKDRINYNSKRADIWSLGVILANMISGRGLWSRADGKDDCYRAFLEREEFMRDMLPISHAAAAILRQIFQSREEDSIDLPTLKKMVEEVDTFFMTDEELEGAQRHARSTAEDYFRPLSNKPVVTPPLVRQLVEVDDEWSQGLPYGISHLGSGNSGQSSGTSVAMESSEGWENSASHSGVRLGLPRQRVMPLIRDPSRSEGQIAWQRGKTVPAHMRPYSFRPSFDESESDSESGTCSLGSDECEADSGASTKRLGKSFPWNAHPSFETVGSIEPRRVIFGGIETGRFVGQYQKPWARMTAQFRRVLGIV